MIRKNRRDKSSAGMLLKNLHIARTCTRFNDGNQDDEASSLSDCRNKEPNTHVHSTEKPISVPC